jgi:hypothetical protein
MAVIRRRHGQLAELPHYVVEDREYTLRRVLSDFPEPLLAALISGLEIHGNDLRCGTLFASHTSSCAAGAMIRELYRDQFECSRVQFMTRHRWRKRACSYGGTLATGMHASLLEAIFDRAVVLTMAVRRDVTERAASRVAGQWILSEAERELGLREDRIANGLPAIVSWRDGRLRRWGEGMDRRLADPVPVAA